MLEINNIVAEIKNALDWLIQHTKNTQDRYQ